MIIVSGSLNYDVTLFVDEIVEPKTKVRKIIKLLGGSGGNIATAIGKVLGSSVIFLGCVGNDEIGKMHINFFRSVNVNVNYIKVINGVESGQAYVIVDKNGKALIFSYSGANNYINEELLTKVKSILPNVKYIVVSNPPLNFIKKIFLMGKNVGAQTVWDPGAFAKLGIEEIKDILVVTDYFLPNFKELLMMTSSDSLENAIKKIRLVNKNLKLLVKKGEEGSLLVREDEVITTTAVPLRELGYKVLSTVGCGDVFTGTFVAFKYLGYNDEESIKYATASAAFKALHQEPRASPTYNELINFYNNVKSVIVQKKKSLRLNNF